MAAVEGEGLAAAGSRLGVAGMMAGNPLHLEEDRELAGSLAEAAAQSQVQEVEPPSQIAQNVNDQSDNQCCYVITRSIISLVPRPLPRFQYCTFLILRMRNTFKVVRTSHHI